MINTIERLAVLVVGVVSVIFVYGMLSMAWAGCNDPECVAEQKGVSKLDKVYTLHIISNAGRAQVGESFASLEACEREGAYRQYKGKIREFSCHCGGQCLEDMREEEIPPERHSRDLYTLWTWSYGTDNPNWWGLVGQTYEECIEARNHYHLRGNSLGEQEADPDMEAHRPECLPDGRGHPGSTGR
jgi:hypothetical protein